MSPKNFIVNFIMVKGLLEFSLKMDFENLIKKER